MSVVIVGGNERMERQYKELCEAYSCTAKVFTKQKNALKNIGCPDLLVLFTSTMSHSMLRSVICETKGMDIKIERSHTSSMSALRNILETHATKA